MKIIVIEGTDNTGKDTLINGLRGHYADKKIKVIHCQGPKETNNFFASVEQDSKFIQYAKDIVNGKYNCDILIFNRSWYGESVYGPIYRGRNINDTLKLNANIEQLLINFDITFIQLMSNNINLLIKNDDNKSLANKQIHLMLEERKLFKKAFSNSKIIKKKIINVNDSDNNFIPKEKILQDAKKIIDKNIPNNIYVKEINKKYL